MFERLRKRGLILAGIILAVSCLCFATPALGEDVVNMYSIDDAQLTKVVITPTGTNTSGDTYTFHFAGGGTVQNGVADNGENPDSLYSDGVVQDAGTISVGDVIPQIADYTMQGRAFDATNSLTNGQSYQFVVQAPLSSSSILGSVSFPHAGIYTYRVTERSVSNSQIDSYTINNSRAEYLMRVHVTNNTDTQTQEQKPTVIYGITVDKILNDDGRDAGIGKVNPTYPKADVGKITFVSEGTAPANNTLAGANAERGRDVYGFTFANEYVQGGPFVIKKLVEGQYANKSEFFNIKLEIHDQAATAANSQGACVTYQVNNGKDNTNGGILKQLDGVSGIPQATHNIAEFDSKTGIATIEAELKEGGTITITGVFGPFADDYSGGASGQDKRMTLSTTGLLAGETFRVTESSPGNYEPTGYKCAGDGTNIDPRNMTADAMQQAGITTFNKNNFDGGLVVEGTTTGKSTTVIVVNKLPDSSVNPTGILIDNLSYILMIAVPLAVFVGMFVAKRRKNAAA